jgi:hypothetical protein
MAQSSENMPDITKAELKVRSSTHNRRGYTPIRLVAPGQTIETPMDFIGVNYVNPGESSNVELIPESKNRLMRATRPIQPGEELLAVNYGENYIGPSYVGAWATKSFPMLTSQPDLPSELATPPLTQTTMPPRPHEIKKPKFETQRWLNSNLRKTGAYEQHTPMEKLRIPKQEYVPKRDRYDHRDEIWNELEREAAPDYPVDKPWDQKNNRYGSLSRYGSSRYESIYGPSFGQTSRRRYTTGSPNRRPPTPSMTHLFDNPMGHTPKTVAKPQTTMIEQSAQQNIQPNYFAGNTQRLFRVQGGRKGIKYADIPESYIKELERRQGVKTPKKATGKSSAPEMKSAHPTGMMNVPKRRHNPIFDLPNIGTNGIFSPGWVYGTKKR